MVLNINETNLLSLNFKGRGDKEQKILSCFKNNLKRQNEVLFDCVDIDNGKKFEIKKQKRSQWFDPSKFLNLSEKDKKIIIIFLLIDKEEYCDIISTVNLEDFVNRCFTNQHLQDARNYAIRYPKDQIKSEVNIRKFIEKNSDISTIVWRMK